MAYAEGAGPDMAAPEAQGKDLEQKDDGKGKRVRAPGTGEWAQTIGTFKPAYRPVPQRWKNSEILSLLRKHVIDRSAGSVHIAGSDKAMLEGERKGGGLGFMPELKNFDR
jgi:hypothetical protein